MGTLSVEEKFGKLENKKYIAVFDLEITCWEEGNDKTVRKDGEIIEIGIVILDYPSYSKCNTITVCIKPECNPVLSNYCKELTGISQKEINEADYLIPTLNKLIEEKKLPNPKEFIWCAWGGDAPFLQNRVNKVETSLEKPKFDPRHINLKLVDGNRRGLKKTLSAYNIPQETPAHRALPDAISTARLAKALKVSPLDCMVSNSRTYRQKIDSEKKNKIKKLANKFSISEKTSEYALDQVAWDFSKAKHLISIIQFDLVNNLEKT